MLYLVPGSDGPPPAAPVPASEAVAPPAPAVRLQHEVITVNPAPSRPKPSRPPAQVRRAHVIQSRPAGTTMIARAKRMLFGDGSHRPAPFPKPGRP